MTYWVAPGLDRGRRSGVDQAHDRCRGRPGPPPGVRRVRQSAGPAVRRPRPGRTAGDAAPSQPAVVDHAGRFGMTAVPDFEALYRAEPDPWRVGSSFYEQRKLALVLGALSRPRYEHAWDPASRYRASGGPPGGPLPPGARHRRCRRGRQDHPADLRRPGQRASYGDWRCREVESAAAEGPFDLVVVSEFLYYLTDRDRAAALAGFEHVTGAGAELRGRALAAAPARRLAERGRGAGRDARDAARMWAGNPASGSRIPSSCSTVGTVRRTAGHDRLAPERRSLPIPLRSSWTPTTRGTRPRRPRCGRNSPASRRLRTGPDRPGPS